MQKVGHSSSSRFGAAVDAGVFGQQQPASDPHASLPIGAEVHITLEICNESPLPSFSV